MSAFTPGSTAALRTEQTEKVLADKQNEAKMGHDGCWVSHPYFITGALSAFSRDNQLDAHALDPDQLPDLLPQACEPRTLAGLQANVRAGIAYMRGWMDGIGCVAWDDLMEDLATLEISRAQTWQWLHHRSLLADGQAVTVALVERVFEEELERICQELSLDGAERDQWTLASKRACKIFIEPEFLEFFTTCSEPVEPNSWNAS
jgi:malate synthase